MKIVIIDPACPEFVRGSQSYVPYLLHAAEMDRGAVLIEDFNVVHIDDGGLPLADQYWVALWSPTQIEQVRMLARYLPASVPVQYFGYWPLLNSLHLPCSALGSAVLLQGMKNLSRSLDRVSNALIGDNDMHLKKYPGPVYPLYTTYGCPNGCAFCPATVGQHQRLVLGLDDVQENIRELDGSGRHNVHVMDDDFFFDIDRASMILGSLAKVSGNFKVIVLASRHSLSRYIAKFGCASMHAAGVKLIEVGLESASEEVTAAMGKNSPDLCGELSEVCSVPIMWLTLSFFPGETVGSLNATGDFLRKHGLSPHNLFRRIATNGTVGGLGQFFQPYVGTKGNDKVRGQGVILTERPIRLAPSFVPHSFLRSGIRESRSVDRDEAFWYDNYRVRPGPTERFAGYDVQALAEKWWEDPIDGYISLAVSARLGVVR